MRTLEWWIRAGVVVALSLPVAGNAASPDSLTLPSSGSVAPAVSDSATADSDVADSDVADSVIVTPPAEPIRIELERHETWMAALVVWRSDGYLLAVRSNGSEELIGTHRVRTIHDATGRDRTHFVIDKRGAVGTPPPAFQGSIDPARFQEKKRLPTLLGVPLFAAGIVVLMGIAYAIYPPEIF
jgi:hypothetical protein